MLIYSVHLLKINEKKALKKLPRGTWLAQSVQHPALGFDLGHDLGAIRSSPDLGSMLNVGSAGDSFSLSFPSAPLPVCVLSLINK